MAPGFFSEQKSYSPCVGRNLPTKPLWGDTHHHTSTSLDLYFGPEGAGGLENNWIPTAGKTPFFMFRIYGPTEKFWDKSFKLPDIQEVK